MSISYDEILLPYNVESCNNLSSVKYLYKSVYKGHDCASVQIVQRNGQQQIDKIKNHIDGRFVSPPRAVYRLFEYKLKGPPHSI